MKIPGGGGGGGAEAGEGGRVWGPTPNTSPSPPCKITSSECQPPFAASLIAEGSQGPHQDSVHMKRYSTTLARVHIKRYSTPLANGHIKRYSTTFARGSVHIKVFLPKHILRPSPVSTLKHILRPSPASTLKHILRPSPVSTSVKNMFYDPRH